MTPNQASVIDLSIIGRWDPDADNSMADVMLNAKITPQPDATVSLLHLQALVANASLLRVVPLLPDGTSPRKSPGVASLKIPTVAGRNKDALCKLSKKVVKNVMMLDKLDGSGAVADSGLLDPVGSEDSPQDGGGLHVQVFEGSTTTCDKPRTDENIKEDESLNGGVLLEQPFSVGDVLVASETAEEIDHSEVSAIELRELVPPERSSAPEIICFGRACNGHMTPTDMDDSTVGRLVDLFVEGEQPRPLPVVQKTRHLSITDAPRIDQRGRLLSSGSFLNDRGLSPLRMNQLLELTNCGPILQTDGSAERSSPNSEDISGALGLVRSAFSRLTPDKITMIVANDHLKIWFPQNCRTDAVVLEIHLMIKPCLTGEFENYHTFIFSGLPQCKNGAYINFQVINRNHEKWVFNLNRPITSLDAETEDNRVCGQIDLHSDSPIERGLVLRLKRVPYYVEIYDHKISTETTAMFSRQNNGSVVADFAIKVTFVDAHPVETVSRNLVNLILINGNGVDGQMSVFSECGECEPFSIEGPVMKNGQELKSARLIQILRNVEHVHESLTVWLHQVAPSTPTIVEIPVIEMGGPKDLLDQKIIIHKPSLPLTVECYPTYTFQRGFDHDSADTITYSRIQGRLGVDYLRTIVYCLESISSDASGYLEQKLSGPNSRDLWFIENVTYDLLQNSVGNSGWPMRLQLRMTFELEAPESIKDGREILRVNAGCFSPQFVTVNARPTSQQMTFFNRDELVLLNYGSNKPGVMESGTLKVSIYWTETKASPEVAVRSGSCQELSLPQVVNSVTASATCKYNGQDARLVSRPRSSVYQPCTVKFANGKAQMYGIQTFDSRLYLQIPLETLRSLEETDASLEVSSREFVTADSFQDDSTLEGGPSSLDGPSQLDGSAEVETPVIVVAENDRSPQRSQDNPWISVADRLRLMSRRIRNVVLLQCVMVFLVFVLQVPLLHFPNRPVNVDVGAERNAVINTTSLPPDFGGTRTEFVWRKAPAEANIDNMVQPVKHADSGDDYEDWFIDEEQEDSQWQVIVEYKYYDGGLGESGEESGDDTEGKGLAVCKDDVVERVRRWIDVLWQMFVWN